MRGKKLTDMSVKAMTTTLTNLTPAMVTAGTPYNQLGLLPLGYYKGSVAFWDLNLAVNEPNVMAEQQYIMGILDGREEGYDLRTVTVPLLAPAGTLMAGTLVVPAGELWYINCVQLFIPFDATAGFTVNWACSLWTDRIGAAAAGQPFRTAAVALANVGAAGTHTVPAGVNALSWDEFGEIATGWMVTNKVPLLRLPAGTILTFTVLSDTAAPTVATPVTMSLFGAMARILVA